MTTSFPTRNLGRGGPAVPALGLGLMGMSDFYGTADRTESLHTIRRAIDAGVTFLDTGDFYGSGHNELLLAEILRTVPREDVFIAVKFGALRDASGGFVGVDTRPASTKNFLAMTLRRLGTDYVDLYQPARLDPTVPIEETVGAIGDMLDSGHVRHIGLSEVGAATLKQAVAERPVASLQIEYSLLSRGIEDAILPAARELGVAVNAYGVLSRGLLSGRWRPDTGPDTGNAAKTGAADFRSHLPRFEGENLAHNLSLVDALRKIADDKGVSVAQLAIAWVLARGEDILPLIGARTRARLDEALGGVRLVLDPQDIAAIERAVPKGAAAGDRYGEGQMAMLDSEHTAGGTP
ncbi:aldo/keto reductase [Eilatimonas milleporae]|uniref:Aryl-alcohol dehydrogenase-like predicted oxidoreductase n=1 Tax=Eilatimonas milleporae TaxID=911205 RepID=A0A3M0CE14_9PROT|nr:aldo/keto reductase [Eilatimonas milleporae]RMB08061.1 aryl-alcohol dehydrogenase-like predicted oxidoreductase [Eilatimonas milleporae]